MNNINHKFIFEGLISTLVYIDLTNQYADSMYTLKFDRLNPIIGVNLKCNAISKKNAIKQKYNNIVATKIYLTLLNIFAKCIMLRC